MPVSIETYERLALEDREHRWELWCGELREKPPMTMAHEFVIVRLGRRLNLLLDPSDYFVYISGPRLSKRPGSNYVPDLVVISNEDVKHGLATRRQRLAVFDRPAALVVEVWSRSTGGRDARTKLRDYQQRGDAEIWIIHPRRRTLTAWRRQPDGTYTETVYDMGTVPCLALPRVTVDLATLFEMP
jgi:Uma2 family endonuclease